MSDHKPARVAGPKSNYNNWITAIGAVLATGSLFSFALLVFMDLAGGSRNPYLGIFTYVVAPMFLIAGLGLVFFGAWAQRRWAIKHAATMPDKWRLDFHDPRQRRVLAGFAVAGLGFLLLSTFGGYQSYHLAESNEFCGLVCHSAMKPEWETYHRGAHARLLPWHPCRRCARRPAHNARRPPPRRNRPASG